MSKYSEKSLKVDLDLEFPVPDPGFNPDPPRASWEAGYKLSLMGLEMIKDRPEIWEERKRRRCYVEFKL